MKPAICFINFKDIS